MRKLTLITILGGLVLSGILEACTAGPQYSRPAVEIPDAFKELKGWKSAQPRDAETRGPWWKIFEDPVLARLLEQVNVGNQSIAQAEAQFRLAQALVQSARSGFFPVLSANASSSRSQSPALPGSPGSGSTGDLHSLSLEASWEADLWGKYRRTTESSKASEEASEADLNSLRLSIQATLAQNYFTLRSLDAQEVLLEETISGYEKSLELTKNRYAAGVAGKVDVVQAETQLRTTQAQATDLKVQRAQLEHAIAVLIGKPPASLALVPQILNLVPPSVPVSIPSELLERRPDISAAERRVAAANAQIGVAKSAFFPAVTLSGNAGYQNSLISQLLTAPSLFWSIGGAAIQNLFDGGLRDATVKQMEAAYDSNVAAYRQTVLNSFQEVEDSLASLRLFEREAEYQDAAVQSARQSVELFLNQYKAGTVSYLDVVSVQSIALANERTAINILSQRLTQTVSLVKALGGTWKKENPPS